MMLLQLRLVKSKKDSHHTTNQPLDRIKLVQPHSPELGNLRLWNVSAAEEDKDDDDERVQEHGDERAGRQCGDRLPQCDREQFSPRAEILGYNRAAEKIRRRN